MIDATNRDWIVKNYCPVNFSEEGEGQLRLVTRSFNLETSVLENDWTIYAQKGKDLKYQNSSMITQRVLSLHEQIRFLREAGWSYVVAYGDFGLNSFKIDSNKMITVSKKEG